MFGAQAQVYVNSILTYIYYETQPVKLYANGKYVAWLGSHLFICVY